MSSNKTTFIVNDVDPSITSKDLSMLLGMGPDGAVAIHNDGQLTSSQPLLQYKVSVNSLDHAMTIFKKHNFTELRGNRISMEFWPKQVYINIPEVSFVPKEHISRWKIYDALQGFGTVVSIMAEPASQNHVPRLRYCVSFATKQAARNAEFSLKDPAKQIGLLSSRIHQLLRKNCDHSIPDFWIPPKAPEKSKGNLIDVPTNSARKEASRLNMLPAANPGPKPTNAKGSIIFPSSREAKNPYRQPYIHNPAQEQRSTELQRSFTRLDLTLFPGEAIAEQVDPRMFDSSLAGWCETAFVCYETLHNLSSKSAQGQLSISSLAWSTQLDISTFRLHYGSTLLTELAPRPVPVLSSLTVKMREYGDKDSAAQMLSIRHNGQLTESREALVEDINVQAKGPIMAMKCLESGHVVTSSGSVSAGAPWNLYVWDLRDKVDQAKTPVARLSRNPAGTKIWFDAKGTDVCSVDKVGTIYTYDLYKAVSSGKHSNTANVDFTANIDIDREFKFYSSCISINALDSTVLTGSDEHAQIARWDPRSPTVAAFTTTACLQKGTKPARINFDAVYGIEWNPNNSNEFLTVHAHTVRVWDARKMDNDTFATFHDMGRHSMSKAYWSPHRSNCIAGLNKKGQVNIWEINKFDGAANLVTPVQNPKQLFVHQGHELVVSDFAWCPYVEDVICTVAPGTKDKSGNIQVWRPRNLHDVDDNGEP